VPADDTPLPVLIAPPPPHDASITAAAIEATHEAARTVTPVAGRMKRIQCSFLMGTAMSDLFDEYPMLIFALESLVALLLLIFIVVWTASGKKKNRANDSAKRR
jgi:hypothetical protein